MVSRGFAWLSNLRSSFCVYVICEAGEEGEEGLISPCGETRAHFDLNCGAAGLKKTFLFRL